MGLDMYLYKKTYVSNWSDTPAEEQHSVEVKLGGVQDPSIKPERISHITEEVMYWRKANQIHGWFCNKTQEIADNLIYQVDREDLEDLLLDCKKVLQILKTAPKGTTQVLGGWKDGEEYYRDVEVYTDIPEVLEILPPCEGFFFGSNEVDDYYKETIEFTIKFLEEELSLPVGSTDYEYHASW